MASIQRIALFVLFDSLENDLTAHIRQIPPEHFELTADERLKSQNIALRQSGANLDPDSSLDLIPALDLGIKLDVILRHKSVISSTIYDYFKSLKSAFSKAIPIRNAIMHGRPLTIDEYAIGFAFSRTLLEKPAQWPSLQRAFEQYTTNPLHLSSRSIELLKVPTTIEVLHNLPTPDYEDTGFLQRRSLEQTLKQRILGRYPVITILGDGGNGKTALALQTLWNLVDSNDHDFDLIIWFSAKTATLSPKGVNEISDAVISSSEIIEAASEFEPGSKPPIERLKSLLASNKVLLVIDNLETVTGELVSELISDVPGSSKVLLTSRVPVGGDLPVAVPEFTDSESETFLRTLAAVYGINSLRTAPKDELRKYCARLGNKPLLIKWFALGVGTGLDPARIIANPKIALKFCLENVIEKLSASSKNVAVILSSVSEPISTSVLSEIGDLSAIEADDALTELNRFGLLEVHDLKNSERNFRLRPFVRSYVTRVVEPNLDHINSVQKKFQTIQIAFEKQKASTEYNRYDPKQFTVRTKSEAVAAAKLRRLARDVLAGRFDVVEAELDNLKISNPGYFEVYRFEAFAAFTWSDLPRAIESYEAALEYGDDQAQLFFLYAGMLMRSGSPDLASARFAQALVRDPDAAPLLREASRNEQRLGNFELANAYLSRAEALPIATNKDAILLADLRIQFFTRQIEHLVGVGAFSDADALCGSLLSYVSECDQRLLDATIWNHLNQVFLPLRTLRQRGRSGESNADLLYNWLSIPVDASVAKLSKDSRNLGSLKQYGRKPSFGFLIDIYGVETFVASAVVERDVWTWMMQNGRVTYSIRSKTDGRTECFDVKIHN